MFWPGRNLESSAAVRRAASAARSSTPAGTSDTRCRSCLDAADASTASTGSASASTTADDRRDLGRGAPFRRATSTGHSLGRGDRLGDRSRLRRRSASSTASTVCGDSAASNPAFRRRSATLRRPPRQPGPRRSTRRLRRRRRSRGSASRASRAARTSSRSARRPVATRPWPGRCRPRGSLDVERLRRASGPGPGTAPA